MNHPVVQFGIDQANSAHALLPQGPPQGLGGLSEDAAGGGDDQASAAAGEVHTDMERGFIRAHVARLDELVAHGGWHDLQRAGLLHTVGKDYQVQDGDVIEFLFNV